MINLQVKDNILKLINIEKFQEAQSLLNEYMKMVNNDAEVYSIQCVLHLKHGNIEAAQKAAEQGLEINPQYFDLLYNLGYIAEMKSEIEAAYNFYTKAQKNAKANQQIEIIQAACERIAVMMPLISTDKLAIICIKGLDSFIHDISRELSKRYVVKKYIIENDQEIHAAIDWADIIWLEWGNESTIVATQYPGIKNKKVFVRIHGYEVFTDMPAKINWSVVNKLIFVAEHKREVFFQRFGMSISKEKTCVIRNGIDIDKFNFTKGKEKNKNIACIGNINYRKGIDLLLQFFYELIQNDSEYRLFIRGDYQDLRYQMAIDTMLQELQLQDKVIFVDRVDNLNNWLKNMSFIVSSSIEESFHYSVGEGMLAGLKPVIFAWRESRDIWPSEFIFKNSFEFRKIILDNSYEPECYRQFVIDHYSLTKQIHEIYELLNAKETCKKKNPLVTIGVTNYNAERYIDECITSMLNQTYTNLEIIVVDDVSTDKSFKKLQKFARKHKNIKVIQHSQNSGSPDLARQEIIDSAKGQYFMLFDSDDFFADNAAIEKLVRKAKEDVCIDYVYCDLSIVNEQSIKINEWQFQQYNAEQIVLETFRRGGSGILTMKGLFKTKFFKDNNIPYLSNGTAGDTLTSLLCMQKGMKIKYLSEPLIAYRQHQNNFTFDMKKRIDSIVAVLEYIVANFDEKVYFSDSSWDKYNKINRETNKYYLITQLYYHVFKQYYEGNWKPWEDGNAPQESEKIKEYLIPLRNLIMSYSQKIINTDCYNQELNAIREYLTHIYNIASSSAAIMTICQENTRLKFLLRRIENCIDVDSSVQQIIELLTHNAMSISSLILQTKQCTVSVDQVLNDIGAVLYNKNYVEDAIKVFRYAFNINSENQDVLMNLGIIYFMLGDKVKAKEHLTKLKYKTDNIIQILQQIEV
ncbi:Glycosyltransferase involved in cell wall bisynthesis [Sporomusa acidovorans]|nr:Glycosyltransferase involved in cell wall bisynthesis [Sporomusa acidovorans]